MTISMFSIFSKAFTENEFVKNGKGQLEFKKTTYNRKSFFSVECYFILTGEND